MNWTQLAGVLLTVPGLGQVRVRCVVEVGQSLGWAADAVWSQSLGEVLRQASISDETRQEVLEYCRSVDPTRFLDQWEKQAIRLIGSADAEWPPLLQELEQGPVVLFAKGRQLDHQAVPVAVVGTRNMTEYGSRATHTIVRDLVSLGCTIVSGCMYGIDTVAHQTALASGGRTVGVLGYGFHEVYPQTHAALLEQFLAQGATLLTPFAPNKASRPGMFRARNWIVAGMSEAVVVTEAAERSGTHITAGAAIELGRPVCAVAGPFNSLFSEGTKILINNGAVLVSSGRDVWNTIRMSARTDQRWETTQLQKSGESPVQAGKLDNLRQSTQHTTRPNEVRNQHLPEAVVARSTDSVQQRKRANRLIPVELQPLWVLLESAASTIDELAVSTERPISQLLVELTQLELLGMALQRHGRWSAT